MAVQWRQGDVLFERIEGEVPADALTRDDGVLFTGELSGHAHRVQNPSAATVLERDGQLFLRADAPTTIVHEEHRAIALAPGLYRVWRQREYERGHTLPVRD